MSDAALGDSATVGGAAQPDGLAAAGRHVGGSAHSTDAGVVGTSSAGDSRARAYAREWWPLIAMTVLAAVLRLATLGRQSLWYDEAFTPVHVLHPSLVATLEGVVHSENTPPLWYVLEWGLTRAFGTGAVALRLLSALAGIATVPVAWAIGRELAGRRAAIATSTLVATAPLFVWYSQEARAYALFVLAASLALLCFLRALRDPTPRRLALFGLTAALALLTHYFAVFLLVPMVLWLLLGSARSVERSAARDVDRSGQAPRERPRRASGASQKVKTAVLAAAPPVLVGAALVPLVLAQGGHGTQWIGQWALASRLEAVPQYYLTGYTGAALGHGVEALVAFVILAGVVHGLWRTLTAREERGALIALVVAASGVLVPLVLAVLGADYLAPRNLVAAMVPVTALLAILIAARRAGAAGMALAALLAACFLALTIDVFLSPRLQRGDWRGVAAVLRAGWLQGGGAPQATGSAQTTGSAWAPRGTRVVVAPELGAAPLEYYLPPLSNLARGTSVRVDEVDEVGYAPLRASAGTPPAPGLRLVARKDVHGLIVYRFASAAPVTLSERALRASAIGKAPHPEALAPKPST